MSGSRFFEVTCEPSSCSARRAALSRDALVNQPPRALVKGLLRAGVVTHGGGE